MRGSLVRIALLFLFLAASMPAWGTDLYDLKINEVCPVLAQGVVENDPGAWIELYNPLTVNVSTAGLRITDGWLNDIAVLPMIVLPPNAYLVVQLGTGEDDYDASDGTAVYNLGLTDNLRLPWEGYGLALFRGQENTAENIRDFIAWGTAPLEGSPALEMAVQRNIWREGAFWDVTNVPLGASLGMSVAGGLNRGADDPWAAFTGAYDAGIQTPGTENLLLAHPLPGEFVIGDEAASIVPLAWVPTSIGGAQTGYRVVVDRYTSEGDRINVLTQDTDATSTTVSADYSGEYVWRVDLLQDGRKVATGRERHFYVPYSGSGLNGEITDLHVPYLQNLKDTGMLCIYNIGTSPNHRPGCDDLLWNRAHTPGNTNDHDTWYSARAGIAMVNHYFGGDMSQDRLSYQVFHTKYAGAEGDLGHGIGFKTAEVTTAYRYALGVTTNYAPYAPGFEYIQSEVRDLHHPVLVVTTPGTNNREGAVIGGEAVLQLYSDCPPMPAVLVLDPRAGASYWILYSYFSPSITGHYQISGSPAAVMQEASITVDSDTDGIVDFDETPQNDRFQSSATSTDTDGDGIPDLLEIYCYTFHHTMDNAAHSNIDNADFSDVDADGLRSENDTDSDNGGKADGLEDVNHNGIAPEANETCPYLASDDHNGPPNADVPNSLVSVLRLERLSQIGAPTCRFRISLPKADRVSHVVLDVRGRLGAEILSGERAAGVYDAEWNGCDRNGAPAASGIYFARLATDHQGGKVGKFSFVR